MDNPHVPACNEYIRITILFSLTPFKIDLQGTGVTWSTHMSPLVIRNIRITILFSLTTFKIDLQGAGVTWTTHTSPFVMSRSESLSYLA